MLGRHELVLVGIRKECVGDLVQRLPTYVRFFDLHCPFSVAAMVNHTKTIRLCHKARDKVRLVRSPAFARSLYQTLVTWGMNSRGARLKPYVQFTSRLKALVESEELTMLQQKTIFNLKEPEVGPTAQAIWRLILRLDPVRTNSVIVTGTKALHHVLPDIVPPVDRQYTLTHLLGYSPSSAGRDSLRRREQQAFRSVFQVFWQVAKKRRSYIEALVKTETSSPRTFHTSALKVIDNAIIGARLWSSVQKKQGRVSVASNG